MINDENENSEVKGARSTTNSDALTAKPRPGGYSGSSKADESIPSFCVCENDSDDDDDDDDGICSKRRWALCLNQLPTFKNHEDDVWMNWKDRGHK